MRALHHALLLIVLAIVLGGAGGCSGLPRHQPGPVEQALQDVADTPLGRLASAATPAGQGGDPRSGFRLLFAGESAFNARIALAGRATRSLDVQYYMLAGDRTGRGFLRELRDAAQRGVRVRLLVDDLYAAGDEDLLAGLAAHTNVSVRLFNPLPVRLPSVGMRLLLSLPQLQRINHRMHNKLLIADNSLAVSGGRNVADEYFMNSREANFVDLDVLSAGPVVRELSAVFDRYWNSDRVYTLQQLLARPLVAADREYFDEAVRDATIRLGERQHDQFGQPSLLRQFEQGQLVLQAAPARVLADDPGKAADETPGRPRLPTVSDQTLALMDSARDQVLVMSPYFIPGERGMQLMRRLAAELPGGVTLLTNSAGATDEPLAYAAYARYRPALLAAGVRIHELSPTLARDTGRIDDFRRSTGRLHSKTLAVDRRWLFVGSMNLDPRSARANTEAGLVIDSPALAQQVVRVFDEAIALGSYRLRPADRGIEWIETDRQGRQTVHAHEPYDSVWQRLKSWLLGLFVPEQWL